MAFFATLTATAVTHIPMALILLYVFNWRKPRSIFLTIVAGTILNETLLTMLSMTRHWGDGFYLHLTCFTVHTIIAYGLIRLKKRMDKRGEEKY